MMQKIQIQNLDNNPGILPFKLGKAKIKIGTHTFLHYIQLSPIINQINSLENCYENLKYAVNKSSTKFHNILYNFHEHVGYQLKITNEKIRSFYPIKRSKRGLINPLGSVIKYITGNLDYEDGNEIYKSLSELQNSQNKVITKFNKHISITKNLMYNINKTMSQIIQNQNSLENKTNELIYYVNQAEFEYYHYIEVYEILDQIKLNVDSILHFLTNVENAVSFASMNVLHRSIVSLSELKEIYGEMYKIHSHEQLLFSNEKNVYKYYDVIETKVYMIKDKIIFSLDLPLVHSDTFDHYHLYSIPNKNRSIIIPPSTYLSLSSNQYQYTNEECIDLQPNFLCKQQNLLFINEHLDCVTSLLSTEADISCPQIPVKLTQQLIFEINKANYIGIFPKIQKLQMNCKINDVALLEGTYLFSVPPKCSLKTSHFVYTNDKIKVIGHPVTLNEIKVNNFSTINVKTIKLEKISLDKLHEITLQETSNEDIDPIQLHLNYSRWSICSFLIIFIIIILYALVKVTCICFKKARRNKPSPEVIILDEAQVVPPSSSF